MPRPLATLMLLVTALIWGLAFTAQKTAMASMGPLTFSAVRYLLASVIIAPLAWREYARRGRPVTRRQWAKIIVLGLVFFMAAWLQQVGLTITSVINGGFLTALYVLFVPLIALVFTRTSPHAVVWLCVPLALIGTFYLNGGTLDQFNTGDLLIVICAVFWALQVILLGHLARETSLPILISTVAFVVTGLVSLPLALVFEHPTIAAIAPGWLQIAYTAILASAVAFTMQAVGQQYVPASNAAIVLSAESLFSALGGVLLLGERLSPIGYAGAALIFLAIVLVETVPTLTRRAPQP